MAKRLTDREIDDRLEELSGWELDGDRIHFEQDFDSFTDAIAFINRVARLADAADHHPEIFNVYSHVELELTTHDAEGLTAKDFDLAAQIDEVVEA